MAKTVSKTTTHYSEDRAVDGLAPEDELPEELEGPDGAAGPLALVTPMQAAGTRLDVWLAQALPQFSRNRLKTWIEAGAVTLGGAHADPKQKIRGGEAVKVLPQAAPDEGAFTAEAIPLDVVYEDATIIVINKPAGLVTHPAAGNWNGTLLNALLHHAPQLQGVPRAGIVHRLDKETSGLLVVAKTLEAQTALVRQLQARTVKRLYWALVAGNIDRPGTVAAAIGRHPTQRTRMAVLHEEQSGAKAAVTHYRPLGHYRHSGAAATLAECRLESGRTHQIRVHMQHIKHPLVGDPLYGQAPSKSWFTRQALHARELALVHPRSGKTMAWEAPLPADMESLLQSLEPA
ncbi:MAG: pseudouridine synthase [Betaproteobacteria bacterium]|nr:pseudouridine synthase [Betaproteobacteria bacterium]